MTSNPEHPARRSPRLIGYNYAQSGAYFVTICTHQRLERFGAVSDGVMQLNALGQIAEYCWSQIPSHFSHVELDLSVVMPNHVHGIVLISNPADGLRRDTIYRVPTPATAPADPTPQETFSRPVVGSFAAIIRSYKATVTREMNRRLPNEAFPLWQGRYHDHIIRNEADLNRIQEYVINNPARWHEDVFYGAG